MKGNNKIDLMDWSILNDLKEVGISGDPILFLVVAYRYFNSGISSSNTPGFENKKIIIESLVKLSNNLNIKHSIVIDPIIKEINQINNRRLDTILHKISVLNQNIVEEDFPDFFDVVLEELVKYEGIRSSLFLQPTELTLFISALIKKQDYSSVYNPYAGMASYEIILDKPHTYYGQEVNIQLWSIGILRLFLHKKLTDNVHFINEDAMIFSTEVERDYDLIVSSPPFGKATGTGHRTYEHLVIEKGLQQLCADGRMFVVVSAGFLSSHGQQFNLRKLLIESDLVESVISLPLGIIPGTGVRNALMVINRNKENASLVNFVDGTSFYKKTGKWDKSLDFENLLLAINNSDNNYCYKVDIKFIAEHNYSFEPARYSIDNMLIPGVSLSTIADFSKGISKYDETVGKVVRVRNLFDEVSMLALDTDQLEYLPVNPRTYRKIEQTCVLVSVKYRRLKPTLFEFQGTPVFLSSDIAVLIPKQMISARFLTNELDSEYVSKQIDIYRSGGVIPYIKQQDLMSVKINLPSPEEQEERVRGLLQAEARIDRLTREKKLLVSEAGKTSFDEYASLKHTLGTPRQNILDWSNNLIHFLQMKDAQFVNANTEFRDIFEINILEALKIIRNDINFITEVMERGEKGLIMSEYPLSNISLKDIKKMIESISDAGLRFRLIKEFDLNCDKEDLVVLCNLTLLKILIENILSNANKHAFSQYQPANEVAISMLIEGAEFRLEIKNNGKPFPKNFNKSKFSSKFITTDKSNGSGLGGYDIDRIATYLANAQSSHRKVIANVTDEKIMSDTMESWDLILNENPLYPVIFRFTFDFYETIFTL